MICTQRLTMVDIALGGKKFPKKYHRMLSDALIWLDKQEPLWNLPTPMDKIEYCQGLVDRVANTPKEK